MSSLLRITVVAGLLLLAASTATFAQRETTGSFRIVSNDNVIGLVPGQLARVYVVNGIDNPSAAGAKPRIRVSALNGNLQIAELTTVAVDPGKVGTIDIKYADLDGLDTDPETGRREFRVELTIDFTGLESDAKKIRPILKSLDGGKTWTLMLPVPTIQKIR